MSYPRRPVTHSNEGCLAAVIVLVVVLLQLIFAAAVFGLVVWAFFNFVV